MSEKKIVVPEGMLDAFMAALLEGIPDADTKIARYRESWRRELTAAIRWLSENPIVPTERQAVSLSDMNPDSTQFIASAWQRRMFLAPEPEIPEEVTDLLWNESPKEDLLPSEEGAGRNARKYHNRQVLEAFRRGQKNPTGGRK